MSLAVPFAIPLAVMLSAAFEGEGTQFFEGSWKDALEKAKNEKKLVFADFYTDW